MKEFESYFSESEFLILDRTENLDAKKIKLICGGKCKVVNKKNQDQTSKHSQSSPMIIISDDQESLKKIVSFKIKNFPHINISGAAYINYLIDEKSKTIGSVVFPVFFIGLTLITFILFKSFSATIFASTATIFSALLGQAIIKILYTNSNIILSIAPLLVSILIYATLLHILFQLNESRTLKEALKRKFRPIVFMAISTIIGLFSLFFSRIEIISTFGIVSAGLLCINFLLLMAYVKTFPMNIEIKRTSFLPNKFYYPKSKQIYFYFPFFIILPFSFIIIKKIPHEIDASSYFSPELRVKEKIKNITKKTGGIPILDIIVEKKKNIDFHFINSIEEKLKKNLNLDYISPNKLVSEVNSLYSGSQNIPVSPLAYYPLYSKAPKELRRIYPIDDKYRISILGNHISGEKYENILKETNRVLEEFDISYSFTGIYYWLIEAQRSLISTLLYSLCISLICITIMVGILFKGVKKSLIFLVINIYPIIAALIFYLATGITFNIATVMTFSISLGLMADGTFHLYYENSKNQTLSQIHKRTMLPIFWSNIILALLFSCFTLINFLPIKQFGLSMAYLTIFGLGFDIFLLPRLLGIKKL